MSEQAIQIYHVVLAGVTRVLLQVGGPVSELVPFQLPTSGCVRLAEALFWIYSLCRT